MLANLALAIVLAPLVLAPVTGVVALCEYHQLAPRRSGGGSAAAVDHPA